MWSRVVNSQHFQAAEETKPRCYNVFFEPRVTGGGDENVVLSFDIMSFNWDDDLDSWLYIDKMMIDELLIFCKKSRSTRNAMIPPKTAAMIRLKMEFFMKPA